MYSILVCDDDKDIVAAIKIYLESEGYGVITAYDGKEALEKLSAEDVHLVLMDIMMPVMDGISAMVEIRRRSNVPVILLTAKSEDTDKVLGLNVGADDYITKPFNVVEMLARVRSQLRRYMHSSAAAPEPRRTALCWNWAISALTTSARRSRSTARRYISPPQSMTFSGC